MIDAIVVVVDEEMINSMAGRAIVQRKVTQRLLTQTGEQGVSLAGPGSLLSQLAKNVVEATGSAKLTEYLGHEHSGTLNGRERA